MPEGSPQTIRLIQDEPAAGTWNMAVDEAILRSTAETGTATLRIYGWNEPTLSLGYFQKAADRESHTASLTCPLVRRASGGGAILHHHELTYSFIMATPDSRSAHITDLFQLFHNSLVAVLQKTTSERVALFGSNAPKRPSQPFLCFQRRNEVDVLVNGSKVCGSAQRRHQDAILQHGSVLLRCSPFAPELPGIVELTNSDRVYSNLSDRWLDTLSSCNQWIYKPSTLTQNELSLAIQIEREKFASDYWTHKR